MTAPRRRRFALALGAVAIAAVALRVGFVAGAARPLPEPGDAMAYHLLADGLAAGDGYVRPFDRRDAGVAVPTAEYAPAHPALLAVADAAGIDTTWGQRFLGAVLGAVAVVLTGVAGRRFGGRRAGLLAAAVVAAHPLVVGHDTTLLSEGLAVAAGAGVLALGGRVRAAPTTAAAAVAGGAAGAAALVRGELVLLVAVAVVAAGSNRRAAAAAVVAAVAVVAPWTARNALRLDAFVPITTNVASAVAGANCDATYHGPLRGYWAFRPGCFEGYRRAEVVRRGEAAVAGDALAGGVAHARANPGAWPAVAAARARRVWGLWSLDQQAYLGALEGKAPRWERAGTIAGWVLLPLAGAGLAVAARRSRRDALLLAIPMAAVTVTAIAVYGHPRLRAAAEPAVAVAAALALAGKRRGPG